jgi:hypothetical protein
MSGSSRRRGARIQTQFQTLFSHESGGDSAVLAELSSSGARLQCPEPWPAVGSPVALYVWLPNQAEPSETNGSVVRHTGDGFAMEFEKPGQETCLLVDAAAHLVRDVSRQTSARATQAAGAPPASPPPLASLDLSGYSLVDLEAHAERVTRAIAALRGQPRR